MANTSNDQYNSNNNKKTSTINCPSPQTPLITVSGQLCTFLLEGHLASQINCDLARESIEWQRTCYDISPVAVYVEANFVQLDPVVHLLWDVISKHNPFNPKKAIHQNNQNESSVYFGDLFAMLAKRYSLNFGGQVLLNSYWIDANNDLERYNQLVRQHLLEWFDKILTLTAYYNQLGFNQDFEMDFFVVIVVRCQSNTTQKNDQSNHNAPEQLLNLSSLMNDSLMKSSKPAKTISQTQPTVTSIQNSCSHQQLAEQIRNDLLSAFHLFRQNHLQNGCLAQCNNNRIISQLLERVIIFDSTSNASWPNNANQQQSNTGWSVNGHQSISSTAARTLSALSNLSASSIKLSSSMSPTHRSSRSKTALNLSSSSITNSSVSTSNTPVLNYSQFIIRIRQLLLQFYTKQFDCLERLVVQIRDLRTEPDWDYLGFFLLQEELALGYESLGLYSKALMQYDELEVIFSQLILNGPYYCSALSSLISNHSANGHCWTGLCLCNQESLINLRMSIVQFVLERWLPNVGGDSPNTASNNMNLLHFRNYLFARQCHLLCLLNKPWQLASRALPFLQSSVAELNMLEIDMAPGGIACWVFLSVLEILHKCERYSDSSQLDSYSYHTVGLWSYARDNLIELGKICKLMPESQETKLEGKTWQHLHHMVELVAGMGSDPHLRPSSSRSNQQDNWMSPQERLKDALSSPESFLKHYLELSELTMGTYKHIGHLRRARFIGKQLAELNLQMGKGQAALSFLLDLYHMFDSENWFQLKQQACCLLAQCLKQLYLDMSQSLTPNHFSLEAIIRSAFRTYLLLLLHGNHHHHSVEHYLDSMHDLVINYQTKSADHFKSIQSNHSEKLMDNNEKHEPILMIHNSYSDLLDAGARSSRPNSNCSSSNESIHENDIQCLHCQTNHHLSSNNNDGNQTPFVVISNLQISCGSALQQESHYANKEAHSFIAGSMLKLKLSIDSALGLQVTLRSIIVTLQCSLNDPALQSAHWQRMSNESMSAVNRIQICSNSNCYIDQIMPNNNMDRQDGDHWRPLLYSCHCSKHQYARIVCLNENELMRAGHKLGRYSSSGQTSSQVPIWLFNERLANDDYCKYHRYLWSPFKFQTSHPVDLKPGLNEYELTFQTPDNLYATAKRLNLIAEDDPAAGQNINHVWFQLDQLILFCQYQVPNDKRKELICFGLLDDFTSSNVSLNPSLKQAMAFRLVKCPPCIEVVPAEWHQPHSSTIKVSCKTCFIGIDQTVCLRLNSGTSTLPKYLKCFVKIEQEKLNPNEPSIDCWLVNNQNNNNSNQSALLHFELDHQLDPFETYQLELCLCSSYSKCQSLEIEPEPKAATNMNNSFHQYEFKLSLSWDLPQLPQKTSCHFSLCDPFQIKARIFSACASSKLIQVQISASERLHSSVELYFGYPSLNNEPNQSSQESSAIKRINIEWKNKTENETKNDSLPYKLIRANQLNFIWSLNANALNINKLYMNLCFKAKLLNEQMNVVTLDKQQQWQYQMQIHYRTWLTRYTIRQSIEPLMRQTTTQNSTNRITEKQTSEIIRVGNCCILRLKIQPSSIDSINEDQLIMFELMSDGQLWALSSKHELIDNISTENANDHVSNDYSSRLIRFDKIGTCEESYFETILYVTPLTTGYLPLPRIRVSLYRNKTSTMQQIPLNSSGNQIVTNLSSNPIESLSAMFSENLSLTGKNWSKYLSSNNAVHLNDNSYNNNKNAASLQPFLPGQIYNYNRSSQVYVLPSLD